MDTLDEVTNYALKCRIESFLYELGHGREDGQSIEQDLSDLRVKPVEVYVALCQRYEDVEIDFSDIDTNGWQGDTWVPISVDGKTFDLYYGAYYGALSLQGR